MHDFEGIHDHVGEVWTLAFARDDLRNVIELLRIRDGQNAATARLHPYGLIVMAPVEQVAISGLLQEIRRERGLRNPGSEPAARTFSGMPLDGGSGFLDEQSFFVFGKLALTFGVGA